MSGAKVLSVTTGRAASASASDAAIASAVVREPFADADARAGAAASAVALTEAEAVGATEAIGAAEAAGDGAEAAAEVSGRTDSTDPIPSTILEMAEIGARVSS